MMPSNEEQLKFAEAKNFVPQGKLRMKTLRSVTDMAPFEGFYHFLLGVNRRKLFRVSEMSNPARLIVDFKH